MAFQNKTEYNGKELTLTLSGRLDTLSAAELENEVHKILETPFESLIVEISELDYISSSGLRCFVKLYKGCKGSGAEMTITGMQPSIREIFDLTGFSKIFGLQ